MWCFPLNPVHQARAGRSFDPRWRYVPGVSDEPIDVVLSVGALDPAVAALREYLHRTGALELRAIVDRGAGQQPAFITLGRATPVEVTEDEQTVHLPHGAEIGDPPPMALPDMPLLPPFELDPAEGVVSGPIGGVQRLAEGVTVLAGALGGRSVALAFFATTDADTPLGIAGRAGEEPVLTIGEEQFTLPR